MARRARGEGSIYRRESDGRMVGSLTVGYRDGKRIRKTVYGDTKTEVIRKLGRAKAEHERSALVVSSPTVESWLRYWLEEIASVRPSTRRGYETYIEKHLIPRIGKKRVDRLEPSDVRRLYSSMRSAGLAEASVRQTHAILSRALKIAVREGKASRNVALLVDAPGTGKNPRQPLTVEEARKVLATADAAETGSSRWYAALWLGLRQGEALGLRWTHVNLDEGFLFVEVALQRVKGKGLVLVSPKSASSVRVIPLPKIVESRLRVDWARHVAAGGGVDGYVWGGEKPTDPAKDYKAWGKLLADAKVPYVALHAARNTTGSLLMAAGVPDKVTAEILGHSTVTVTRDHYLRGDLDQYRAALTALEAYAKPTGEIGSA